MGNSSVRNFLRQSGFICLGLAISQTGIAAPMCRDILVSVLPVEALNATIERLADLSLQLDTEQIQGVVSTDATLLKADFKQKYQELVLRTKNTLPEDELRRRIKVSIQEKQGLKEDQLKNEKLSRTELKDALNQRLLHPGEQILLNANKVTDLVYHKPTDSIIFKFHDRLLRVSLKDHSVTDVYDGAETLHQYTPAGDQILLHNLWGKFTLIDPSNLKPRVLVGQSDYGSTISPGGKYLALVINRELRFFDVAKETYLEQRFTAWDPETPGLFSRLIGKKKPPAKSIKETQFISDDILLIKGNSPSSPDNVVAYEISTGKTYPWSFTAENQRILYNENTKTFLVYDYRKNTLSRFKISDLDNLEGKIQTLNALDQFNDLSNESLQMDLLADGRLLVRSRDPEGRAGIYNFENLQLTETILRDENLPMPGFLFSATYDASTGRLFEVNARSKTNIGWDDYYIQVWHKGQPPE